MDLGTKCGHYSEWGTCGTHPWGTGGHQVLQLLWGTSLEQLRPPGDVPPSWGR